MGTLQYVSGEVWLNWTRPALLFPLSLTGLRACCSQIHPPVQRPDQGGARAGCAPQQCAQPPTGVMCQALQGEIPWEELRVSRGIPGFTSAGWETPAFPKRPPQGGPRTAEVGELWEAPWATEGVAAECGLCWGLPGCTPAASSPAGWHTHAYRPAFLHECVQITHARTPQLRPSAGWELSFPSHLTLGPEFALMTGVCGALQFVRGPVSSSVLLVFLEIQQ